MPIKEVKKDKKVIGYQWGDSGKLYTIIKYGKKGAFSKAKKQGQAIHANTKSR